MRETPVLVVGAGPAGLTAAITLARQGVADARRGAAARACRRLPRATVVSTRSMEIFRSWGLEDEITRRRRRRRVAAVVEPTRSPTPRRAPRTRSATRPASRARCSARPARPACRRTTSSRCCSPTCARCRPPRSRSAPRWSSVAHGPDGVRVDAARRRRPARARSSRPRYVVAGRRRAQRRAARGRHRDARPGRPRRQRHRPVPRAAVGPARPAPLRHLRRRAPRGGGRLPARRARRPLALRRRRLRPGSARARRRSRRSGSPG